VLEGAGLYLPPPPPVRVDDDWRDCEHLVFERRRMSLVHARARRRQRKRVRLHANPAVAHQVFHSACIIGSRWKSTQTYKQTRPKVNVYGTCVSCQRKGRAGSGSLSVIWRDRVKLTLVLIRLMICLPHVVLFPHSRGGSLVKEDAVSPHMRKDNAVNCNSLTKKYQTKETEKTDRQRRNATKKKRPGKENRKKRKNSTRESGGLLVVVCPQARGASPCYGRCRESPQMGR
jgi:hypothetical protein